MLEHKATDPLAASETPLRALSGAGAADGLDWADWRLFLSSALNF